MRYSLLLRLLMLAVLVGVLGPVETKAATLNVVGGILVGASDVDVDGSLFDVSFLDGTCVAVFDGCDELADFAFTSHAASLSAQSALIAQVIVGSFSDNPELVSGCELAPSGCIILTPYGLSGSSVVTQQFANFPSSSMFPDGVLDSSHLEPVDVDAAASTWAVWSPVAVVPEPAAAWLVTCVLVALRRAAPRRRTVDEAPPETSSRQ